MDCTVTAAAAVDVNWYIIFKYVIIGVIIVVVVVSRHDSHSAAAARYYTSTNTVTSYSIILPHQKCNIESSNQAASRSRSHDYGVCSEVPSYFIFNVAVSK